MQRQSSSRSAFLNTRVLLALFVCAAACFIVTGTLLAFFRSETPTNVSQRTLTFAERVAYQHAIEDVYWHNRIWPKERPDAKPSLDAVMSQAQLEKKVADYLRKSQALEGYWRRPITAEQLQAEMDRMAKHTKQPEVLHEVFEALGNDPFVIAECLARPAIVERLITNWYAYDQRIHGDLKQRAKAELLAHPSVEQMKQLSGSYTEIEFIRSESRREANGPPVGHGEKLSSRDWDETVQKVAVMFGDHPVAAGVSRAKATTLPQIKTGVFSALQEDETRFYAMALLAETNDQLKVAAISWPKGPLESWLARAESEGHSAMAMPKDTYTVPTISGSECIDDTWTATAGPPEARYSHTAVWTGSEMIIWGGGEYFIYPYLFDSNTPADRYGPTAIWTGSEMVVWGVTDGFTGFNTGGRYDPATNSWTATSTGNVPTGRYEHAAVWTGTEMIIWGGYDADNNQYLN